MTSDDDNNFRVEVECEVSCLKSNYSEQDLATLDGKSSINQPSPVEVLDFDIL